MANPEEHRPRIPIPVANPDNAGFWEGCRQHELRLQRCVQCRAYRHHPRPCCPICRSFDYEWSPVSGGGVLYSFTIAHGPTLPVFQEMAPYNVAVVELAEGPFLVTNVVDCPLADLRIGMPVEVTFEEIAPDVTLPRFRPVRRA